MPGIVGLISARPAADCATELEAMVASMMHEPFYTSGTHMVPDLGVYAAWVGFVDAPGGSRVECVEDPNLVCLRSGEIAAGAAEFFASYRRGNADFVAELSGTFSGLLVDTDRGRACLFNDCYGFDRLYLHHAPGALYFASEAKALLRILPHLREFDRDGLTDYLTFGCTTGTRTLFRGMELLPPASLWCFERGKATKRTYFDFREWQAQQPLSPREFEEEFATTAGSVIRSYFGANGRDLGVSLTGGLDSRLVVAARPSLEVAPTSYTYDAAEGETLDTQLAQRVAKAVGWTHHTLRLNDDFFSTFSTYVDRTVYLSDGTFGATGAHESYFSMAARRLAPVRLTGVFGGEIFRGVSTFKPLGLDRRLFDSKLALAIERRGSSDPTANDDRVTAAARKEIPWGIFGSIATCRSQLSFRTPYLDQRLVALAYRMPAALQGSARPFVSAVKRFDVGLAAIPTDLGFLGNGGSLVALPRRALAEATFKLEYLRSDGIPRWARAVAPAFDKLSARVGFGGAHKYLRYRHWFRQQLAGYVRDSLASASVDESGIWDKAFIRNLADEHISGRANYLAEIHAVLTLEAVKRCLLGVPSASTAHPPRLAAA